MSSLIVQIKKIISEKVMVCDQMIKALSEVEFKNKSISEIVKHQTSVTIQLEKKALLLDLLTSVVKLEYQDTRDKR